MVKPSQEQPQQFYARDREEWRRWLEENHAAAPGVWLIFYKKHARKPSVSYEEAVEEALCYGWIDSKLNALDGDRYIQLFTPRKPKSTWSKLNKQRAEKMIEQGRMTPVGMDSIRTAKQNGMWEFFDEMEALTMPDDLEKALASNAPASEYFRSLSDPMKKQILRFIASAKRPETRVRRIEQVIKSAEQKENPFR